MERWRARLAVAGDPGAQAEQAGGAEEGEQEESGGGGAEDASFAGGEYEFVAEGERKGHGGPLFAPPVPSSTCVHLHASTISSPSIRLIHVQHSLLR